MKKTRRGDGRRGGILLFALIMSSLFLVLAVAGFSAFVEERRRLLEWRQVVAEEAADAP